MISIADQSDGQCDMKPVASLGLAGVIFEIDGSVRKIQKRTLFYNKNDKKGTPSLTSPYFHSFLTIVLIKQTFE